MPASSKSLGRLVAGFWMINLILAAAALVAWISLSKPHGKAGIITPVSTQVSLSAYTQTLLPASTFTPSATPFPTLTTTPTDTPIPSVSPTPTITATNTQTPIPYSEGPLTIGYSVESRPLEVYRFGNGPINRLIVAGMHGGGEYNTVELADQLIAYLQVHPEIMPADISLYILEDLNPDGVARSKSYLGRANANGVDLNRNWDANWQVDWPRLGCWTQTEVNGGTRAGSEPETQALAAFILKYKIDAIINYHSAALGVFAGGIPPGEKSIRLAKAIAAVSTYKYPPIDTGCDYTGGFTDWADIHGSAAVDLELTNHTDTDYDMNLIILNIFLNWKR